MLKGEKVWLRAVTRDDLPRVNQFNNDVAVELAGGGDPPLPQSLERLEAEFNDQVGGGGRDGSSFAIEAMEGPSAGQCIGVCALFAFDETSRRCELGITIGDRNYWGKGYGREAVGLLLDHAFRHRNMHKVYLTVHGSNERAIRAYAACGFIEEGRLRQHVWSNGAYDDLVCMGVLRGEWER